MRNDRGFLRRALALVLATVLALPVATGVAYAEATPAQGLPQVAGQQKTVARLDVNCAYSISKYGNVLLDLRREEFFEAGFALGDIVRLSFLDKTIELPVCESYNEVTFGSPIIISRRDNDGVVRVTLGVNTGDFASAYGVATQVTAADGGVSWKVASDIGDTFSCTFEMAERGGYESVRKALGLVYTDERSDYAQLTDDEYANLREVTVGAIAPGVLYRSASPVNPRHNRNLEVDAALRRVGVDHIIDLANDETILAGFEGYATSHYANVSHLALNMTVDLTSDENEQKIAEAMRYIAHNRGSYDVCCLEGKDRTGFVCAVLECLMGATADEVIADYMVTFRNYYGVVPGDESYGIIVSMNIKESLGAAFGVDSLEGQDLSACATAYLERIGVSGIDVYLVKNHLSTSPNSQRTFTISRKG